MKSGCIPSVLSRSLPLGPPHRSADLHSLSVCVTPQLPAGPARRDILRDIAREVVFVYDRSSTSERVRGELDL